MWPEDNNGVRADIGPRDPNGTQGSQYGHGTTIGPGDHNEAPHLKGPKVPQGGLEPRLGLWDPNGAQGLQ